jgi:hypothetical protein
MTNILKIELIQTIRADFPYQKIVLQSSRKVYSKRQKYREIVNQSQGYHSMIEKTKMSAIIP